MSDLLRFSFVSSKCGFCVGKTHCEDCSHEFEEIVTGMGCRNVRISTKEQIMELNLNGTDEDDLLDRLECLGVMADQI